MIRGLSRAVDARTAPFAWEPDGDGRPVLVGARVTQCALSRICGACAASLGRPVAFVGDADEVARNAFHAPPLHEDCARAMAADSQDLQVVLTAGFEFVRPVAGADDRRPTFQPNSLL